MAILKENLKNTNLVKHSLAVEGAMRAMAKRFSANQEQWGLCGLLHDIDYEKTAGDATTHSKIGSQMLKDLGLDDAIVHAVLAHNEAHNIAPQSQMAKALFCVDPLTGLIVASALVLPSKKLADLKTESILKRFKEPAFAKGANREIIKKSEELLGLALEEFIQIALEGMQNIAEELGLY